MRIGAGTLPPLMMILDALFDRNIHQATPFGPRTVIVPDVGISKQLSQHKPRVTRTLANSAVGDDLLVRRDPLRLVDPLEFIDRFEGAVLICSPRPRDALCAFDVS